MAASVELTNVSYAYPDGRQVLHNIDLKIEAGEKFGLIGPMGAGKSTLLLQMNGILYGTGCIKIGQTLITRDTLAEIRRSVGLVFQNPDDQLFNPTVEEDIAFGPLNFGYSKAEAAKMVHDALVAMQLEGFEKAVPHHLSMGERKRVALATVLAMQPEVIAFDEPFSSLDASMTTQLVHTINQLKSTVIIISQSFLPLMACCQRVGLMNKGKIIATGDVKEILSNDKLLLENGIDLRMYRQIWTEMYGK